MAIRDELKAALLNPKEDLSFEYKAWLDLDSNHGEATLAKAVIAMANADGGYVVIGFSEEGDQLRSVPKPEHFREIKQDIINAAVQRFSTPALHVRVETIENTQTGVHHPVIVVPSTATTPVMATRDCEGVLRQAKVYVRQPGPRSEEPRSVDEWRQLLDRCVQRSRSTMLDAIRAIVEGRIDEGESDPDLNERLADFIAQSRAKHDELLDTNDLPKDAVERMPLGRYEIGLAFEGAEPIPTIADLLRKIDLAHRISLTGWPKFLVLNRQGLAPYPSDGVIEAWLGNPQVEHFIEVTAAHSDFWRIAPQGMLYMRAGYDEDHIGGRAAPGEAFELTLPIWRIGEAILFARRLAATYENVQKIIAQVRWSGLRGRALKSLTGSRTPMSYDRISQTDFLDSSIAVTPTQIDDNLPEVLHQLIAPVYELFAFYELPRQIVEQELEKLMRRG